MTTHLATITITIFYEAKNDQVESEDIEKVLDVSVDRFIMDDVSVEVPGFQISDVSCNLTVEIQE